jgi:hypothetical protein
MKPIKLITLILLCSVLAFGLGVIAYPLGGPALPDAVPKLIPYQGVLERDGVLVNAIGQDLVGFRVALFDASENGNRVWPDLGGFENPEEEAWDFHSVNVHNGRFSFNIGTDKPYLHIANTPLYLEIGVKGPEDPDFVQLGARQQFLSSPYAVAASRADVDFTVPGQLSASNIDSTDPLNLQISSQADTVVGGKLQVGDSIISGASIISANMSCRSTGCGMLVYDLPGSMYFGQWRDWLYCPEGMYVCGARQRTEWDCGGCDDTAMNALSIACCPF